MKVILKIKLVIVFFCLFTNLNLLIPQSSNPVLLFSPQVNQNLSKLILFLDKNSTPNLMYKVSKEDLPAIIYYQINKNNNWSSPITFNFQNDNDKAPYNVKNLSNGVPLLVLYGDDTDYAKLFNIKEEDAENITDISNLGLTQEEAIRLVLNNQRLFFSFYINGNWTKPIPINGTGRGNNTVLETGPNNNALLLFYRYVEVSTNLNINNIKELYVTSYSQKSWSNPVKLTNDNKIKYSAQIKFINEQYIIVWITDEDNDFTTKDDRRFYYAIIDINGNIISNPQPIFNSSQDVLNTVLGSYQGQALIVWSRKTSDNKGTELVFSNYNGSWSDPQETGLNNLNISTNIKAIEISDSLLITYLTNDGLKAVIKENNNWYERNNLFYFDQPNFDIGEVNYLIDPSGVIQVAMAGFIMSPSTLDSTSQTETPTNEHDGIYYQEKSILPDLIFSDINTIPLIKNIGSPFELTFSVINNGFLPSKDYQVIISSNNNVIKTLDGNPLPPGQSQNFRVDLKLDKVVVPYDIKIISTTEESNIGNNIISNYLVRILPDYTVKRVKLIDNTTISAYVDEIKKIAASPVAVDFYLQKGGELIKIGTHNYDPNIGDPITFDYPDISGMTDPFKIIVEVNHDRKIVEDNYMNNKNTFIFNSLPDFTIKNLIVTNDYIDILAANAGSVSDSNVEIILTDNPEIAANPDLKEELLYYNKLNFTNANELSLRIQKNELAEITGQNLYSIINPYNKISESNQNNNSFKVFLINGQSIISDDSPKLEFSSINAKNSAINVQIKNTGTALSITPKVELLDMEKTLLKQSIIPAIKVQEIGEVTFNNLDEGQYILRLTYLTYNNIEQIEEIVELKNQIEDIFIEAENMQLKYYYPFYLHDASGKRAIITRYIGSAQYKFEGIEGIYNIKVTYFDVRYGKAHFKLYIDNQKVDDWRANKRDKKFDWFFFRKPRNFFLNKKNKVVRIIKNIKIEKGSIIKIVGRRDFFDPAIIDCIEFIEIDKNNKIRKKKIIRKKNKERRNKK